MTFATNDNIFVQGTNQPSRQTDLISIDALILLGCVQCGGIDEQKAEVFHRVVQPEMLSQIPISDNDVREALHFMISTATILEEMTRDMMRRPSMGVNY